MAATDTDLACVWTDAYSTCELREWQEYSTQLDVRTDTSKGAIE